MCGNWKCVSVCVLAWLLWLMPVLPSNKSDIVRWIIFITLGHTCSLPTQNTRLHPELKVEPSAACSGWGWGTLRGWGYFLADRKSNFLSWLIGGCGITQRGLLHTEPQQPFPTSSEEKHDVKTFFQHDAITGKKAFSVKLQHQCWELKPNLLKMELNCKS